MLIKDYQSFDFLVSLFCVKLLHGAIAEYKILLSSSLQK